MKIPGWIGAGYNELYSKFRIEEFMFDDAADALDRRGQRLRSLLSAMKRNGLLDVLGRKGYKRIYRLADPAEVALMRGMKIDLSCLPEHVRAVVRTYLRGILDRFRERVISIVLYGSFGRSDYGAESDVDLLLVIDEYEWSEDLGVEEAERLTYKIWKLRGEYHKVTPYPLTPEHANHHRPLYLDLTKDSVILHDKDGFIEGILDEVNAKLAELGAERRTLSDGSWYWDLKPGLKPGEVIEI
ncbi:hypothetical protein AKJ64_01190 [candidate division MSBL1 archaeon SCGC-AAA259E17]|uniref:Polymerase nucleotidyl transferase domain-containing protein n=1 Tax=candidate division MSBL1 archaeon SCGC-AAA259E17 TaxID=1698263 RepID=A0A133UGA4_9EURY|nr:hypothetical protein AKJ64_01190 [candidate division MSBL1 archaeon SCGC-AAA259E17]